MIKTAAETDPVQKFAALLDAIDELDATDPRFEQAVTILCVTAVALSPSEREAAHQLRDSTLEMRSTPDLQRLFDRLKDPVRTARIRQIGFKAGAQLSWLLRKR